MSNFLDVPENVDRASLYSVASVKPSPDTLTKLVKRLRALTLALLPVEVDPAAINESTGRVITPGVISAYQTAAGDFVEALPYCLLRARAEFMWDANHNPADYGENVGRAIACEVLARRIVHLSPPDRLRSIMSSRYQHRQLGGGESDMTSALEVAIDSHCCTSDLHKFYLIVWFSTLQALSFWNVIAFITDSLFVAAFTLRVIGLSSTGETSSDARLKSFQVLSFAAPFIWMKLVTVFDGYKYIGTMQICVARMLKESGIFFALLSVLAIGFSQGLFALDAADGSTEGPSVVVNILVQSLLSSPDYGKFASSPPGLILYYLWNTVTAIILLNVLISLFSSAYSDVIEDAEAQYLAFFAAKTVGMIRAPDSFVYPAPFNLIETFFVVPFEMIPGFKLSRKSYETFNRYVMGVLFFIPLTVIAFYEAVYEQQEHSWLKNWLLGADEGAADYAESRDPEVDDANGMKICRVPFEELVKMFPNTQKSSEAVIISEINELKAQLARVLEKLEA
ncbi:hypothetical protein H2248_006596 [Termitomyces sp. 'cryptogamus']|nr:hypothetical protein H2248_006596 [Termitomyces sp. 'cryptogamus']